MSPTCSCRTRPGCAAVSHRRAGCRRRTRSGTPSARSAPRPCGRATGCCTSSPSRPGAGTPPRAARGRGARGTARSRAASCSLTAVPPRPRGRPRARASSKGATVPPRDSKSRTSFRPASSSSETRSLNDASPPKASTAPPTAPARRTTAVPPDSRGRSPRTVPAARRVRPVASARAGRRSRPRHPRGRCRGRPAWRRRDRRSGGVERRSRPGTRQVRPPRGYRQPRPVGLDGGEVLESAAGDRAGVEEVELEVVDPEVRQPGDRSASMSGTPGWVRSRPTRSRPQLRPASPTSQSG